MPAPKTSTKSVAKKAPAKKVVTPKKAAKKTSDKKALVYASNKQSFWLKDGQILNSLASLKDALSEMEKEVYGYHVTKDKNDFADWVDAVLCDAECAGALRKAKTPSSAKTVVVKYLKLYTI